MSGEISEARQRSLAREAERQRLREERKAEAAKRRAARSRGSSLDDEEEDPNDPLASERRAWRQRQREQSPTNDVPVDMLSAEDQVIAHASRLQSENQQILKNTIKVARETTQVGTSTIAKLNEQTEQFQRMDEALNETADSLSRSERILRGMKSISGSIANMFSSKPKKRGSGSSGSSGLAPASAGTATLEEKDRERAKQKELAEHKKHAQMPSVANATAFDAQAAALRGPPGGASPSPDDFTPSIAPNAKQTAALEQIDRNQRAEDDALDELGDVLGALKEQSLVINQQLKQQKQMIDVIDAKVDHTGARLQKGSTTMRKML